MMRVEGGGLETDDEGGGWRVWKLMMRVEGGGCGNWGV